MDRGCIGLVWNIGGVIIIFYIGAVIYSLFGWLGLGIYILMLISLSDMIRFLLEMFY